MGNIGFFSILLATSAFISKFNADDPVKIKKIFLVLSYIIFPDIAHCLSKWLSSKKQIFFYLNVPYLHYVLLLKKYLKFLISLFENSLLFDP
jgi:uncharacterized membrane protein SirB2